MADDIKAGDMVRRTETHSMGSPPAGYIFEVGYIKGSTVFEKGGVTAHNRSKLEKLSTGGLIPRVPEAKGEVRAVSASGGEKGVKEENYALIPWEAMDVVAQVYNFGASKYAAHNWRKGYEWSKSISALCRHVFAFVRGQDLDPESGLPHLGHAGFHVLSLLTWWLDRERYGKFDDRYTPES